MNATMCNCAYIKCSAEMSSTPHNIARVIVINVIDCHIISYHPFSFNNMQYYYVLTN